MLRKSLLVMFLVFVFLPGIAEAKGGPKGKGRASGGNGFRRPPMSRPLKGDRPSSTGSTGIGPINAADRGKGMATKPETGRFRTGQTGHDHALSTQLRNEERKFTHRQQTAQKLREIAERNGNENLLQTADRMDQKALEHYTNRLNKIDSKSADGGLLESDDVAESALKDDPFLTNPVEELSAVSVEDSPFAEGLSDIGARRLALEERKLQHQLDVAQQLRDISARNGNRNLLETAQRMESMAANRYLEQLQKLGIVNSVMPETLPVP